MKALSVRQPWAWLILHGKVYENRTWAPEYRGPLLIHAAGTMTPEEYEACRIFVDGFATIEIPRYRDLPLGGIVGQTDLVNVWRRQPPGDEGQWWTGPVGLELRNPKELPFKRCRGMPGLFEVQMEQELML